ncbi:glycosyltransferase family 4 protein [Microbacterium testaceum]|uniref:glycosyltransferase family 4 protein n=1 Tax=Microbacterium testaceum TaxID=2033 RepID=UPI0035AB8468|nr:glycosyltransferase family 4 protein [Microbacterium testaceum]
MAERLTVSGDFASSHLREGIQCLRECWPHVRRVEGDARIDIYGPNACLLSDIPGSRVHGFVDDIGDLYRGNTVVVVLNRAKSGVPNKIVEAVAAQRPIIVHESFRTSLSAHPLVRWYHDARSLKEAILAFVREPLPAFDRPIILASEVDVNGQ